MCRWYTDDCSELPVVLLSEKAYQTTLSVNKKTREGNEKNRDNAYISTGLYLLNPDYSYKMTTRGEDGSKNTNYTSAEIQEHSKKPLTDYDIQTFLREWFAGNENCDFNNELKYSNRFLLHGRPQLGKTGVLLQVSLRSELCTINQ